MNGKLISILYRYSQMYLNRKLEDLDVRGGQHMFLVHIADTPGIRQDELTKHLAIDPGTVSRALQKMEKKGLIRRETGADRRSKRLFITKEGAETCIKVKSVLVEWHKTVWGDLLEEEYAMVHEALSLASEKAKEGIKELDRAESWESYIVGE